MVKLSKSQIEKTVAEMAVALRDHEARKKKEYKGYSVGWWHRGSSIMFHIMEPVLKIDIVNNSKDKDGIYYSDSMDCFFPQAYNRTRRVGRSLAKDAKEMKLDRKYLVCHVLLMTMADLVNGLDINRSNFFEEYVSQMPEQSEFQAEFDKIVEAKLLDNIEL